MFTIIKKFACMFMTLLLSVSIIGCSVPNKNINIDGYTKDDKNRETIEVVLKNLLNQPNEELVELEKEMLEEIKETNSENSDNDENIISYPIEEFEYAEKLEEMFSLYFTEDAYGKSLATGFFNQYEILVKTKECSIEVESIDIEQSEDIKTNYDFVVNTNYTPAEGETEKLKVKGSVQFGDEEGKIIFIQITSSDIMDKLK